MGKKIPDTGLLEKFYGELPGKIQAARTRIARPLTLAEKILYAHAYAPQECAYARGYSYAEFMPDRVAMQDATAQMALHQFSTCGRAKVALPTTLHCDHLIQADQGEEKDLPVALEANREVYDFLSSACQKYGIGFYKPGAGIIHQVVLETHAFPGGFIIGTDSHTSNAGGLGMVAIGVGGADAAEVMAGLPWELQMPKLIGIKLTGRMSGWTSPKDLILRIAGMLSVKGGTGAIVEYFGEGAERISCTGKATICNMGAEIGATSSIFPYDRTMSQYLASNGRKEVADMADEVSDCLCADPEVYETPELFYDRLIEIDLDTLEPYINGPFTPDNATPISQLKQVVLENGWPEKIEVALVGSCTNSSYEDIGRSVSVLRAAQEKGLQMKSQFVVTPGSETVRYTVERDGFLSVYREMGAHVLANACGPCIGQWNRHTDDPEKPNTILTSYNRNFRKRNDGQDSTHAFVASPEIVTALALAGTLLFNPMKDALINEKGEAVWLPEPTGHALPPQGFEVKDKGYVEPLVDGSTISVIIDPGSKRLQALEPFLPWDGRNMLRLKLLLKAFGKCTTDQISMAGVWLRYRGHLDAISDNLLIGAVNAFNQERNRVFDQLTGRHSEVPKVQRSYKAAGIGSIVVGDENYGEGSSREHAAMEPRHLGVRVILAKSFARIHESNLKKQGMLALTFADKTDYDKIREDDEVDILGLDGFEPGVSLTIVLHHSDGTRETVMANHTYNEQQIGWFKAGSALNVIRNTVAAAVLEKAEVL